MLSELKTAAKLFLAAAEMVSGLLGMAWFTETHRYWTPLSSLSAAMGLVLVTLAVVLVTGSWIVNSEMRK